MICECRLHECCSHLSIPPPHPAFRPCWRMSCNAGAVSCQIRRTGVVDGADGVDVVVHVGGVAAALAAVRARELGPRALHPDAQPVPDHAVPSAFTPSNHSFMGSYHALSAMRSSHRTHIMPLFDACAARSGQQRYVG